MYVHVQFVRTIIITGNSLIVFDHFIIDIDTCIEIRAFDEIYNDVNRRHEAFYIYKLLQEIGQK